MKLDSGHAVTPVEGEEKARLKKTFVGYPDGLVRVSPDRWLFPGRYMDLGNDYYNFEVYGTLLRPLLKSVWFVIQILITIAFSDICNVKYYRYSSCGNYVFYILPDLEN